MDGVILFFSILAALGMGYYKGLNTKRKRIINENKQLKKEINQLKRVNKKLKTIKYDYQVKNGLFKKKGVYELKEDIEVSIKLDKNSLKYFISFLGLLNYQSVNLDTKIDLIEYENNLREMEQEKDTVVFDISGNEVVVNVWDIDLDLKQLFNQFININEYDLTGRELKNALQEKLEEFFLENPKKICRAVARDRE